MSHIFRPGLLSMVRADAIPDLIADLPDHTPPGLDILIPVPEGFGLTPSSPSAPPVCQLQQLPIATTVRHRLKSPRVCQLQQQQPISTAVRHEPATSSVAACQLLSVVVPSSKVDGHDSSLRIRVRRSLLSSFNDTKSMGYNNMTDQDLAVLGILFAKWDDACKCEARNQPLQLKSSALLKIIKTQWRRCGISLRAGIHTKKHPSGRYDFDASSILDMVVKFRSNTKGRNSLVHQLHTQLYSHYQSLPTMYQPEDFTIPLHVHWACARQAFRPSAVDRRPPVRKAVKDALATVVVEQTSGQPFGNLVEKKSGSCTEFCRDNNSQVCLCLCLCLS